jgi:hypothetical protein
MRGARVSSLPRPSPRPTPTEGRRRRPLRRTLQKTRSLGGEGPVDPELGLPLTACSLPPHRPSTSGDTVNGSSLRVPGQYDLVTQTVTHVGDFGISVVRAELGTLLSLNRREP